LIDFLYFFGDFTSYSRKWMNDILTINFHISYDFSLLRGYYDSLKDYIMSKSHQLENVVIIGHSLGGGLAKLLAFATHHPVISFSGGGTQVLEKYFGGGDSSKASRQINVVPEQDIAPQIGKQDGEILPLPCKWGPAECHQISQTPCQIAFICNEGFLSKFISPK
jgi:lipase ATG15